MKRRSLCERALDSISPRTGAPPTHTTFKATAVWLRRIGDHAQVLLEIDGVWRRAIQEHAEGPYSHIAEGNGAADWPVDKVTSPPREGRG
jgi:hypothetical protein